MRRVKYIFLLLVHVIYVYGQPKYNECSGSYFISNSIDWCSDSLEFTTQGSSPSFNSFSACNDITDRDIWLSFYGVASDLIITITPEAGHQVNASLYEGVCNNFIEILCADQVMNNDYLWLYKGGIEQGKHYLLRIETNDVEDFRFSVCLNNYFAPPKDGSDCASATRICSKNSLTVENVTGFGNVQELTGTSCFNNSNESNSIWFRWTCEVSGDLTFVLNPLNKTDDIDFVLYKVNGDAEGCDLEIVRCMAAGVIPSQCGGANNCCGATGLKIGETDLSESAGCGPNRNNFLMPLTMIAGETYALLVNNYTSMNEAFEFSFGGTAEFKGLEARFDMSDISGICRGEEIRVTDRSTTGLGQITERLWSFVPESDPAGISGGLEHAVTFDRSGTKSISLIVANDAGCRSYYQDTLHVDCCGGILSADAGADTLVETGSSIDLNVIYELEGEIIKYQWLPQDLISCDTCENGQINEVNEDLQVQVKVEDERGCKAEDVVYIRVSLPDIFVPNVFSPNDDGINDLFYISSNNIIKKISFLRVYNRWGGQVYEGRELMPNLEKDGWNGLVNGKRAENGVYGYYAEVINNSGKKYVVKGSVTLIR